LILFNHSKEHQKEDPDQEPKKQNNWWSQYQEIQKEEIHDPSYFSTYQTLQVANFQTYIFLPS